MPKQSNKPAIKSREVTPELARDALHCIPADVDRETWVRLAMALKTELGSEGFELWDAWSQQSAVYDAASARDTWRSVKAGSNAVA